MAQSKQRLQVNPILSDRLRAEDKVTPTAAPVNTYFSPNLPAPVLQNVIDLAPLSATLSGIVAAHAQHGIDQLNRSRTAEAAREENLQQYVDPGTSQAWAKKLASGEIDETESPYFYVTQKGVAGRRLAQRYQQEMTKYWDQLTAVNDGNVEGSPVGGPQMTFEQAHDKAMETLQGSPAFADPIVRQEFDLAVFEWAGDYRLQAEGAFRESSKKYTHAGLEQEAVAFLQNRNENGWQDDDEEALQQWDQRLRKEQPSIKDPRVLLVNAALAEAANLSRQNKNQDAKALLDHLATVNIGGMELGAHPQYAEQLDQALDHYEIELDREGDALMRDEQRNTETAKLQAEEIWGPVVAQALASGENPQAAVQQLLPQLQSFGKYSDEVILDALKTAQTAREVGASDAAISADMADALSNFDWERAELIFQDGKTKLLPEDVIRWRNSIEAAKQSSRDLDRNQVWQSASNAVQDAHKTAVYQKLSGQVLSDYDAEYQELYKNWEADVRSKVQASVTPEGQKILDQAIASGREKITTHVRERAKEIQLKQQQLVGELEKASAYLQPLDEILNSPQNKDFLTADLIQQYKIRQIEIEREIDEKYWRSPETGDLLKQLEAIDFTLKGESVGPQDLMNQLALKQRFYQIFGPKLQEKLATTPPQARYSQAYRPALTEASAQLLSELGATTAPLENVQAGAEAGVTTSEAQEQEAGQESAADALQAGDFDPLVPDSIQGQHREQAVKLLEAKNEVQLKAWVSDYIDGTLGQDKSEPEKSALIGDALRVNGFSPDEVISGKASFQAPAPYMRFTRGAFGWGDPKLSVSKQQYQLSARNSISAAIQTNEAANLKALAEAEAYLASHPQDKALAAQVLQAKQLMRVRDFSIGGTKINPYTDIRFKSVEELDAWAKDAARWSKLKEAAGIGVSEEEDQTFYNYLRLRLQK